MPTETVTNGDVRTAEQAYVEAAAYRRQIEQDREAIVARLVRISEDREAAQLLKSEIVRAGFPDVVQALAAQLVATYDGTDEGATRELAAIDRDLSTVRRLTDLLAHHLGISNVAAQTGGTAKPKVYR
jgi:hypothetical protein